MDQIILACDDDGEFLEYIPKEVGHKGLGKRHLAITVLLYNSEGRVILQRRKHKIFNNIWDFTASTHLLHREDGKDESLEEATIRALREEYEVGEVRELRVVGEFNYFAKYREYCENEHCFLMVGMYNGPIKLDPKAGYEYKWTKKEEFLKDIKANPKKYTPWVNRAFDILEKVVLA